MWEVKQIDIKNRSYYFYNDLKTVKSLLKIEEKYYKGIDIYYIGYITIKKLSDDENTHSVSSLHWLVKHASGYIDKKMEIKTWFLIILLMKTKHY